MPVYCGACRNFEWFNQPAGIGLCEGKKTYAIARNSCERFIAKIDMIVFLTESIRLNPNDARLYFDRAVEYGNRGDMDHSIVDYTQAIDLRPDDKNLAMLYGMRGDSYIKKNKIDQAMTDYAKAIKFDPSALNYLKRGMAYLDIGDNNHAIADFTECIEKKPDEFFFYANRGLAYARKKDKNHAIADFKEALRLNPKDKAARECLNKLMD
jgi:tetratricopeptide (TPR) repeat protein